MVTLLDPSAAWIAEVKTASPNTLIVARHNFSNNQPLDRPEQNARDAYAAFRARALAAKGMAYWQLYNEVSTDAADKLALLNRFTLAALDLAEADGVKLAILASSTGTLKRPDEDVAHWQAFLPSVRRAIAGGHVLLVHEYGPRSVLDAQGWHVGRFREARKLIPELAQVKVVISETGIDGGSAPYRLPQDKAGWRGVPGLTAQAYVDQLAQADGLYSDCDNVLGLCVYCVGGKSSGWQSFAIDPELAPLLESYWRVNPPFYPGATTRVDPLPKPKPEVPMPAFPATERLAALLAAEFGAAFEDTRQRLPDGDHGLGVYDTRPTSAITDIVIHHTATASTVTVETVYLAHAVANRWAGIGYTVFIDGAGKVYLTGTLETARAHVGGTDPVSGQGWNWRTVGVSLAGSFMDGATPTLAQRDAARRVVKCLRQVLGNLPYRGHKEFPGAPATACPGNTWDQWRGDVEPRAAVPVVDFGKVVFFLEEAQRAAEREGLTAVSRYIGDNYTQAAILKRDGH